MSDTSAARRATRSSSTAVRFCARRWPIRPGSTSVPTARASAWSRGFRPKIAWCSNNEFAIALYAPGAACRGCALSVDGSVFSGAISVRPEDQPVADRDRTAALCAGVRFERRMGSGEGGPGRTLTGQFQAAGFRRPLPRVLFAQPPGGRGLDIDLAPDRLSNRLRHGATFVARAGNRNDAGDRAVLDLVVDPHLCLDQYFAA